MNKTHLAAYNNSWYNPGAPWPVRAVWYVLNAAFIHSYFYLPGVRKILLRMFGAKIGRHVMIKPKVNIKYPWNLSIGDHSWIGENVWLDGLGKIRIGSNVCISQGAVLICGNHNYKKPSFDLIVNDIILEEGVWIGAMAVVCGGVSCRSHAMLSAGSVAVNDLEPYSIYQGNPAVKVRERVISER